MSEFFNTSGCAKRVALTNSLGGGYAEITLLKLEHNEVLFNNLKLKKGGGENCL